MKKLSLLFVATVAVAAVFFVSSAFTADKAKKQTTYEHFQYTASVYGETDFENDANWTSLGTTNPGSNPCINIGSRVCVARVDQSQLSTNPLLTMPEKFVLYLQGQGSADTYVNTGSNQTYTKP